MGDPAASDPPHLQPEIELCELGPFGVRHDGSWTSMRGERTSILVATLSLSGPDGVTSEQLLEAVWPSPDQPPTARQSLANMVSRLRRAFGDDVIESTRNGYRLGARVSSDRIHFMAGVRAAAELAVTDPDEALTLVAGALRRWRGEPWAGLESPIDVEADRAALTELRTVGLRTQATALMAVGRSSEALPTLREVLSSNPADEQTTELLATALGRLGRRPEALQVIRTTRRSLARSGLVERPTLASLEQALLNADQHGTTRAEEIARGAATSLPQRPPVLVGRDEIVDAVAGSLFEQPVHLLVGRAGAGKSSVFAELLHRVAPLSTVLFGRGDDLTTDVFAAFRQAFAPLRSAAGAEFGALFEGTATSDDASGSPDRLALFEAARGVLADAARRRPIVVGIDDAHWLDDGSALFLRNLALRPVPGVSLLVVARPRGDPRAAMAARLLDDLRRLDGLAFHEIGPLSASAIAELGVRLGRPLDDAEVERLIDAGGNAFVVRELIAHSQDLIEVPDEVASFFERRLAGLPVLARTVLETASLLTEPFDVGLLAELVGASPTAVLSELDRSVSVDLVVGAPTEGFRFRHSLVRDAVAATLAEGARAQVRIDAARVLRRTSDDSNVVAELMLAASSVAEPAEIVEACRRAGERSAAALAHEDAARFFGEALARLAPDADMTLRLDTAMHHAEALSASWRWAEALPRFEEAADLAHALGDSSTEADAVIHAFGPPENYAWVDPVPSGLERAIESLEELDGDRAAALLAAQAVGAWDEGRLEEAHHLLDRARSLASSVSARSHVMRCHLRGWFDPVPVDDRCRLAGDLVELGVRSSDVAIRAYGHRWAVITAFDAGDLAGVEHHLDALAFFADQQRNLWHQWFVLTRRVTLEVARGRLDAAETALAASAELAAVLETTYVRNSQAGAEFLVGWLRGRHVAHVSQEADEANVFIQLAMALASEEPDTSTVRGALSVLPPRSLPGRAVAVLAAPLALASDDAELAQLTIDALREYDDGVAVLAPGAAFFGSVRQRLGYCHLALGEPESALDDFSAAAAHERDIGALACAVRSEWLAGHTLRVLGDDVGADERQERARRAAYGLGIGRLSDVSLPGSLLDQNVG